VNDTTEKVKYNNIMKIALLGDVALFGCNTADSNYREKFSLIKDCLNKYDYIIANLETPLTSSKKTIGGKSAYIKGKAADAEILKYLNITYVSLANNHIFDYGEKGLQETISILERNGISWYGVYDKTEEIVGVNDRIKLRGYCCYSTNGKGMGKYINILNPQKIEGEIRRDIVAGCFPILSFHWGQEHVHYPNYDHVQVAHALTDIGNLVIHGHHPHVLQGIEKIRGSLIAYSMGNFCFDDVYTNKSKEPLIRLSDNNREVLILGLEIKGNKIENVNMETFFFSDDTYIKKEEIKDRMKECSSFLHIEEENYRYRRERDLKTYLLQRKKRRNLEWYLRRLNTESMRMVIANISNRKMYNSIIRKYIEKA